MAIMTMQPANPIEATNSPRPAAAAHRNNLAINIAIWTKISLRNTRRRPRHDKVSNQTTPSIPGQTIPFRFRRLRSLPSLKYPRPIERCPTINRANDTIGRWPRRNSKAASTSVRVAVKLVWLPYDGCAVLLGNLYATEYYMKACLLLLRFHHSMPKNPTDILDHSPP